jgi:L,D-peptidoglycan transpeptidase YkuD (ErfK/YbiS/YcfS/YnhG family)
MNGRAAALAVAAAVLAGPTAGTARAQICPAVIEHATRLALVAADGMQTSAATLSLYRRENRAAPWRQLSKAEPVRLGEYGMAWGAGFRQLARRGEPVKRESDWRTPAGIYKIGAPFGFAASKRAGYVQLKAGETICVDDLRSPAYNTITTIAQVGPGVHGEHMRDFPEYRRGLFIDYPSNYANRADSCIFIHIWNAPDEATAGCIALPEARVAALQDFAASGAVIAILPRAALERFAGCLPGAGQR